MGVFKAKNRVLLSVIVFMTVILLLTVVYFIMDRSKMIQAYQSSAMLIDQVENYLQVNDKRQQALVDSLKENYTEKAKAVSYILDKMPGVETDIAEMIRIAKLMAIDEIHLFDESGAIYSGTVPAYYGYSFDSGEQMAYFKPMLSDKTLSMCQDVTPNTAESKPMMYAICWNDSGKIMVQIGIEPRRLIEEMRSYDTSELVMGIPTYVGVDILLAVEETGVVKGSTERRYEGKNLSELGLVQGDIYDGELHVFKAEVEKKVHYCSVCKYDDYVIAVLRDRSEVNREIPMSLLVVLFYLLISAVALGLIVRSMTKKVIEEHTNANIDVMTGFLNRRAYETDMKILAKDRQAEDFAYFSVDLNGLKEVNDVYGHEAGDELIVGATQCMTQCFGSIGKLYRIGGDEFIAITHVGQKNPDELVASFENLVKDWSDRHNRPLSVACGYASRAKYPEKNVFELARIADEEMYETKAAFYNSVGKDRRRGLSTRREGEKENG